MLNASVTPIPGSASLPLQICSNIGHKASHAVSYIDSTGDYIGIYIGTVGNEKLLTIIGGGVVTITPVVVPALSRVSLRSMTSTPITNGNLNLVFLGFGYY